MKYALLLLLLAWGSALLGNDALTPPEVSTPPVIDGSLDEPAWNHSLVVSDFFQRFPVEGKPATEKTEVRVIYTPAALYIGFRAFDSKPQGIKATVMRRDDFDLVQNDQFAFAIDSYNDGRNGYWFSTNPLGVRVDAQFSNEGDIWIDSWNGIWDCRTRTDSLGWTAEIEIPFATLRFQSAQTNVMGINFFRRIIRTNEQLFSPMIPLNYSNGTPNVSIARKYEFHDISGGNSWQIKPHAVGGVSHQSLHDTQFDQNVGLDLKYLLKDSLTTNFSLNTDFAEAEVDERQINLTRFRLFFPEKRDFFLENAGNFQSGLAGDTELFFSRRIGLSDEGDPVPILLGAKLTGKVAGFDVGIMDVHTKSTVDMASENFGVLRLREGIASRSYIGGIFASRLIRGSNFAGTYGLDLNLYVREDIALTGYAATTSGKNDGGDLKNRSAFYLSVQRPGERTSFQIAYQDNGLNFDPTIGFVRQNDLQQWTANLFVPYYFKQQLLRNITFGYQFLYAQNHSGQLSNSLQQGSIKFAATSEDEILFYGQHSGEFVPEPFAIYRNIFVAPGTYESDRGGLTLTTKPGRTFAGTLDFSAGEFYGGTRTEVAPSVQWKINRHFTFSQFLSTNFVGLSTDSFTIHLFRSRISYSLNTHLSVAGLLQYDNSTQQWGTNLRFGYLFQEGRELFVVYDELRDDRFVPKSDKQNNRGVLIKFTYLVAL